MHILTGVIVSLTLLSALFTRAYSDEESEAAQSIADFCATVCTWCVLILCLLVGHWIAVVFGKF